MSTTSFTPYKSGNFNHLCAACRETTWARPGWSEFHALLDNSRVATAFMTKEIQPDHIIQYEVSTLAQFYEQTKACSWCDLLRSQLTFDRDPSASLPPKLSGKWKECSSRKCTFTIRFYGPEAVRPKFVNKAVVSLRVSGDGTLFILYCDFVVFTHRLEGEWYHRSPEPMNDET